LLMAGDMLKSTANGVRPYFPKLIVLITNGVPDDLDQTKSSAETVKSANIRLTTIGIGLEADETFLRAVATSQGDYTFVWDFSGLSYIADQAIDHETCLPPNGIKPTCPSSFIYSYEGNLCYNVVTSELNWNDANEACNNLHPFSYLAVLKDLTDQRTVTNTIRALIARGNHATSGFYIGAQRERFNDCSAPFLWKPYPSYPRSFGLIHWGAGEPNCWGGNEDCVSMLTAGDQSKVLPLNDIACDTKFWFVCSIDV